MKCHHVKGQKGTVIIHVTGPPFKSSIESSYYVIMQVQLCICCFNDQYVLLFDKLSFAKVYKSSKMLFTCARCCYLQRLMIVHSSPL